MKLSFQQVIEADRKAVWAAFDNPDNMHRWQQNFASYTHRSGEPGQPGATAELVYNEGKKKIVLKETITERREPDFLAGTYESPHGTTLIVNHFEVIDADTTRWRSWCNFTFNGAMKVSVDFCCGRNSQTHRGRHAALQIAGGDAAVR